MRWIYSFLLYLISPLVFLRLWRRGRSAPAYRQRWGERLARYGDVRQPTGVLWVHAVSVGETIAAVPLVRALLAWQSGARVLVTTTTPTGSARVRELFGDQVAHVYLPYDLPGAVGRFLEAFRPQLAVIMETELWPNLFGACRQRAIPLVVANARLSPDSYRGYRRLRPLVAETLGRLSLLAAQSEADAARFRDLGAPPERLEVVGNLKFDLQLPDDLEDRGRALRQALGLQRPVLVAASTHEGEDEQVLGAFRAIRHSLADALLILIPRHPERFDRVAALCEREGFQVLRRSVADPAPGCDIYLGDTMGELLLMCAASDLAFVGGSLVPTGGHNVLEPAALGLPVLVGPHTFNFVEATDLLLEAGAARRISDSAGLALAAVEVLDGIRIRQRMGAAGRAVVEANRGALQRLLDHLRRLTHSH